MAPLLMQVLRERSRSTIIYFLFAILIIVFVFTFNTSGGSGGCSPTGAGYVELATVHDQSIDLSLISMGEQLTPSFPQPAGLESLPEEFRLQFERPTQYSRFYYLASFPLALISDPSVQLPSDSPVFKSEPNAKYAFFRRDLGKLDSVKRIRVMNDVVESYLVGHEAKSMGIQVSEAELNTRFFNVPIAYRSEDMGEVPTTSDFSQYLGRLGVAASDYRTFIENEMLREKLIDVIANVVTVSDSDVDRVYQETKAATVIEYIEVNPDQIAPLTPVTDEDIAAVTKDKETLEAEYTKRQSAYRQKKKVTVRGLLVEAPSGDEKSAEETAKQDTAREAADALHAKLTAPPAEAPADGSSDKADAPEEAAPTEEAAKDSDTAKDEETEKPAETFEDTQKRFIALVKSDSAHDSKGQDGLFASAMTDLYLELKFGKDAAIAALALERGQYTKPILGKGGYWILFADEVQAEVTRSLEDVTPELARELASKKKAVEWSKTVADELFAAAQGDSAKSLETIATEWNEKHMPKDTETKPGGPDDANPPKATDAGAEKGKEDATGTEKGKEDATGTEKGKEDATGTEKGKEADAGEEKGEDAEEEEEAESFDFPGMLRRYSSTLKRLDTAMPPVWSYPRDGSAAEAASATTNYADKDNTWAEVEGIGNDPALKVALLALTKDKPLLGKVHRAEGSDRAFIIRYVETTEPNAEEMEQDKTVIRNTLRAHQQLEAYRAWYAGLLERALNDGSIELLDTWHQFVTTAWKDEERQRARSRKKQSLTIGQ